MDTALFDYPLPPECIAQQPAEPRDSARLLVVERGSRRVEHRVFRDLPGLLPADTRLFRNDAAVFKARLRLPARNGAEMECLLLHPDMERDGLGNAWWCLLRPGRKLPVGATFGVDKIFRATVKEKREDGQALVQFDVAAGSVRALAERLGEPPLPPYIRRSGPNAPERLAHDVETYQTVYADPRKKIAAAAPTAGLHFTPQVFKTLDARGVRSYDLALRVGLDTFRPVTEEKLEEHIIHREWYEIPALTRAALAKSGGPRLAVGTTTLRALEDYSSKTGGKDATIASTHEDWIAEADIFIYPPREFAGADMLLTNFHLPRSTLMCLVSAFLAPGSTGGIAWLKELYAEAVARGYRFYSYGDAMLIM